MAQGTIQDTPTTLGTPGGVAFKGTWSLWGAAGKPDRGLVDNNYVRGDGSVQRFDGVKIFDERMARVPQTNDDSQATWRANVPPG